MAVVGILILYLLFGFVEWEFNPGLWSKDFRVIFTILTITWLSIATVIRTGVEEWDK